MKYRLGEISAGAFFALTLKNLIKSLNPFVVIEATIGKVFNLLDRKHLPSHEPGANS
ncbi:MAG: hypothetical protein AB4426_30310 [Xenococcaceae cyanobacterium]